MLDQSLLLEEGGSSVSIVKSVRNKKWSKLPCNDFLVKHLKQSLGISNAFAEVLSRISILSSRSNDDNSCSDTDYDPDKIKNYLDPKMKNTFPKNIDLLDMDKAVLIVYEAMLSGASIAVFGDYDVDGATSSALITLFLKNLGVDAKIYIPDRILEGYGPNIEAFKKLKDEGVDVIITVDCGSTAYEAIDFAKQLGMKVIVIDHHICKEIPDADAVVNPNREDDDSEFGYLAAVGVSFLFVVELYKKIKSSGSELFERQNGGVDSIEKVDLLSLLDLVALGTVCDVVPMVGLNRAFVRQGSKIIEERRNIGMKALLDVSGIDGEISTYHSGFMLGPRINAGGRVGEASLGSSMLVSGDYDYALNIAKKLDLYNQERKAIETQVLGEAMSQASLVHDSLPIIYVSGDGWHQGVIGIVAGRIKEKFNKPVAVVSFDDKGIGKASCRSITNIDFGSAVVNAKSEKLLIAGGGHAMAAGFSVTKDNSEILKAFFVSEFQEKFDILRKNTMSYYHSYVSIDSIDVSFIKDINKTGPFGTDNFQPKFILKNVSIVHSKVLKGDHISCIVTEIGKGSTSKSLKAIAFRAMDGPLGEVLLSKKYNLDLIVTLSINKWNGRENPDAIIHDIILNNEGFH